MIFSNLSICLKKTANISLKHKNLLCFLRRTYMQDLLKPSILDAGNRLEVHLKNWPQRLNFSYIWLRDHCRCPECYNGKTFQRTLDLSSVPLTICPTSVESNEEHISIHWPDGHRSEYDYKFLWQNSFEGQKASYKQLATTWNKKSFPPVEKISVSFTKFEGSSKGQHFLVNSILKYGAGIISEVPPNIESTELAVESLCAIKDTFYGKLWSFEANLEHADLAYSSEALGAHTDGTYFTEAPRIQVFHCLKPAPEGGETLLVDGFHIAEQFFQSHPEGYKFLSKFAVSSEYLGDSHHFQTLGTILNHSPVTKQISQIRYNIYDLAALSSIPFKSIQEFYVHLRNLTSLVRKSENEVWLKLLPGQVLFLDNWRVMHGRAQYSGPRIMGGCYIDQNDFGSKARVLGFHV